MENQNSHAATGHLDLVIKFLHVLIVVFFVGAYFTGENASRHAVHTLCGYGLLIALLFRIIWQYVPFAYIAPFGLRKRLSLAINFIRASQKQNDSRQKVQHFLRSALNFSILAIFLIIPITVLLGVLTENVSHQYKEWHELLANSFLTVVILHIVCIVLLSIMAKKLLAKEMFVPKQFQRASVVMTFIIFICLAVFSVYRLNMPNTEQYIDTSGLDYDHHNQDEH